MTARLRARGWLSLVSALHVGGVDHDPNGRLDVAVDGRGRLHVPGTSLAGALRGWDRDTAASRWGYATSGTPDGRASRVVVADAPVARTPRLDDTGAPADAADSGVIEARSGVGIDRYLGTAAPGILYERAVLPQGLWLRLAVDVESTVDLIEPDRAWLAGLLAALAAGHIGLGAAKTRGLGRVELAPDGCTVDEERLDSRAGLLDLLAGRARRWSLAGLTAAHPTGGTCQDTLTATVDWSPRSPVMVRAAADGVAVQALPAVTADGPDHVRLVLPGSSLKGALRSHAERILRTVTGREMAVPAGDIAHRAALFRQQHTDLPLVNALFGAPPPARSRPDGDAAGNDTAGAAAVRVDDCLSTTRIPRTLWVRLFSDAAETGGDKGARMPDDLRDALADLGLERADHVAIDRWTGGAAPGRLFSVLEPHAVTWQPLRLAVDLDRLATLRDAAVALLLLVLRDLAAGRVPLGYATNRGLGDATVTTLTLRSPHWPEPILLDDALRSPQAGHLTRAWCAYLDDGRSQ
jgi:CRISPR/Cas system CSM-associated protein Csm3 (group 7 of RAMP superfamily)